MKLGPILCGLMLALGMSLGLMFGPGRARAEYDIEVQSTLTCSFCGRKVPNTQHSVIVADHYVELSTGGGFRQWGICNKCWKRVKPETIALMEKLKAEIRNEKGAGR